MADQPPKPPEEKPPDSKPKFDPFKLEEPELPGVPHGHTAPPATKQFDFKAQFKFDIKDPKILAAGGGALLLLILLIVWMASGSDEPAPAPEPPPAAASTPAPAPEKAATAALSPGIIELSTLPAEVATTTEMAKPWTAKKFYFRHGTQRMPAVLLRLPTGSASNAESYWAFSLQAPFGRCELEYVADTKRLADEFKFPSRTPMVVDPCTQTVFHPLRYGQIGGAYARGEVVKGSGFRPPLAIDLRIQGKSIIATRME